MAKVQHRHRWSFVTFGGKPMELGFACRCGARHERMATPDEIIICNQYRKDEDAHCKALHKVWHSFERHFRKDGQWKYQGFDAIQRLEKWVAKHPTALVQHCDDEYFTNSLLCLVPHETDTEFMGASVAYFPQCTGEPSTVFFLYPPDIDGLIKALQQMQKRAKKARPFLSSFKFPQGIRK